MQRLLLRLCLLLCCLECLSGQGPSGLELSQGEDVEDRAKGAICGPLRRILRKLLVKSLWKVQEVALQLLGCLKTPTYLWHTWLLGLVKLLLLCKVLQMPLHQKLWCYGLEKMLYSRFCVRVEKLQTCCQ